MGDDYIKLVDRIVKASGLGREEIEARVDAKKAKLSGLISREGAAQIVAAELGISFDNEKLKISELSSEMRKANVVGKITKVFPVREFSKNGREGKVASFYLGDEGSNIRVALWDTNHIELIEKGVLKEGDVVEIMNAGVRKGEMSLGAFSDIKKSNEKMENVKAERSMEAGKFKDVKEGDNLKVRAVVVQCFEPRFFDSKKKEGEKGVLLNLVLDDGTETMRTVLFKENIKKLLNVNDDEIFSLEALNLKRTNLLGEEKFFAGSFRKNSFTGNIEMSLNGVEEVDVGKLVGEMEGRIGG